MSSGSGSWLWQRAAVATLVGQAVAGGAEWHGHLRLLVGAGAADVGRAKVAPDLFDQVRAMTSRRLHPRA